MSNITVSAPLVNGDLWDPLDEGVSCAAVVELWTPNSGSGKASVRIDGESA